MERVAGLVGLRFEVRAAVHSFLPQKHKADKEVVQLVMMPVAERFLGI